MNDSASSKVIRFGAFELDPGQFELRKSGARVKIQDQPLQVLVALLEQPGQLVTRDTLKARLWPDGAFVDADNGLNGAVKKLREVLHDSPDAPRFVETVPRKGYRFVAPITGAADTTAGSSRRTSAFVTAGAVIVALALAAFFFARPTSESGTSDSRYKLAVLPFEDLGPDTSHSYLGEGLTEEVITVLAQLEPDRLGVIARNSSNSYRDVNKPIHEIGEELDVDYVLEGSVRKQDDKLRVTAQLIRVDDHTHLWAETLQRDFGDVLELQRELAERVAVSLKPVLLSDTKPPPLQMTANQEALDAYWKGRYYWNQGGEENLRKSVVYFDEALALDPAFAMAHAGAADAYNYLGMTGCGTAEETYARARQSAQRALQIDDDLAAAHAAMGFALMYDEWQWEAAGRSLRRAVELEPGRAIVNHWVASYYSATGQHDEAVAACERAQELDPLSLNVNSDLAWYYYYARRFDEAMRQVDRTVDLNPAASSLRFCTALSQQALGHEADAFASLRGILQMSNPPADLLAALDERFAAGGMREVWRWLGERNANTPTPSTYLIAASYALAEDEDDAFAWIEKAYANHDGWIPFIEVDPAFDAIREDPRFASIIDRIGI